MGTRTGDDDGRGGIVAIIVVHKWSGFARVVNRRPDSSAVSDAIYLGELRTECSSGMLCSKIMRQVQGKVFQGLLIKR